MEATEFVKNGPEPGTMDTEEIQFCLDLMEDWQAKIVEGYPDEAKDKTAYQGMLLALVTMAYQAGQEQAAHKESF